MNIDEAQAKAQNIVLLAYVLAGLSFGAVQLLEAKLGDKIKSGYLKFILKSSKLIVPGATLSVILGSVKFGSLPEIFLVWLLAIITILVLISPLYIIHFFIKKIFR